jgi:hypothetical protein
VSHMPVSKAKALIELRRLQKSLTQFDHGELCSSAVPGWVYITKTDTVIPNTSFPRRQSMPSKSRPTTRRTLRALGGRRVVIEGFGKRAPTLVAIGGSGEAPAGAWLSPAELRRFVEVARKILK